MRKRALFAALSLGVAIATALAACGSGPAPDGAGDGTITMGFSQVGAESGWRTANTKSVQEAASAAGVDLKFSDANGKQGNQISALRSFIQQGVDVLAFSPVVRT
ncbi:MAG: LacI family transcriptional regulator, partial [Mycolicibacterium sp.]